ncbi:MAG: hypothetical protein HKP49_06955 [Maribacter sp.]|nr:hypothetical protein [Maribacter sp.]
MYRIKNKAKFNLKTTYFTFWRRQFYIDISIAISLLLSPFLIYLHLLFNDNISHIQFFSFKINHGFPSNQTFAWLLLNNTVSFVMFAIWFFTSSKKWKYIIIPFLAIFFDRILTTLRFYTLFNHEFILVVAIIVYIILAIVVLYLDTIVFTKLRKKRLETSIKMLFKQDLELVYAKTTTILRSSVMGNSDNLTAKLYYYRNSLIEYLNKNNLYSMNAVIKKGKWINVLFALLLASMVFLLEIHQFVPPHQEQIDLGIVTLGKNGFIDITTFIYILTSKLSILISLMAWYVSCSYWWKYAIMSPITLFAYQSWEVWEDLQSIDAHRNLTVLSIVLLSFMLVLALSRFISNKAEVLDFYEYLNSEIENQLSKESITENLTLFRKKYYDLKQVNYKKTMIKDYLRNLNDLKNDLKDQLK